MIKMIISGGQTGADIAGIDAAIEAEFPYTGWLPRGRKTERGPLSVKYQMQEMTKGGYPRRTEKNIKISDGTAIFTHKKLTGGSRLTAGLAESWGKPWLHINLSQIDQVDAVTVLSDWLQINEIQILNIAGSRASKDPKIYKQVFQIIKKIIMVQRP